MNHLYSFIKQQYKHKYNAEVEEFYPKFFCKEQAGVVTFCAGYRSQHDNFLSERYLEQPAELHAKTMFALEIERSSIVEIGNFASTDVKRFAKNLVEMTMFLEQLGFSYILCTLTNEFRTFLDFYGVGYVVLSNAQIEKIPDPGRWGRYYDFDPKVILIDIQLLQNLPRFNTTAHV